MILTVPNTVGVGHPIKKLTDAKGREIHNALVADTVTGRVMEQRMVNGQLQIFGDLVVTDTVYYPGPLKVEF